MEIKTLGEICEVISGGTPLRSRTEFWENGDIPWIKIGNMNGKYINKSDEYITKLGLKNSAAKILPIGTILYSIFATLGETGILSIEACTNQAIAGIIIKDRIQVSTEYLYYFLKSKKKDVSDIGRGVAQNNINISILKEFKVFLPERVIQCKIADILDKIENIIDMRKAELDLLDKLVRARFVEMFGDVIHNDKLWEKHTVESLCKEIYGGGTPSKSHPEYYENGDIPWVSSKDMKSDVVTDSQIKINRLGLDNSTAKMVPINSVIMVIRSGILKHTLPVAINAVPITVNQDLKVFIPGEHVLTRFLAVQFKMHEKDILSGVRAVTADNIEFDSLKQRELIVPPIELQHEYVFFLEQIDKSKVEVQKALDKAKLLFDSLMQKYFE